jgi:hypothetical protein
MRVRFSGSLLICCLVVAGCGSSSSNNDAQDGAHDGAAGADGGIDKGGDTITTSDSGSSDAADAAGEDAPVDATADALGDANGGDASGDGGGIPTCSDAIKNSDETGVDCGGHCGKCGPGQPCALPTDCQFGVCKSDGTCGACAAATDCPGVESECQHRTCAAGVCGMDKAAAGTTLTVQTAGDCQRRQCDANGAVQTVADDTDLPDDRNPCTNDLCTGGVQSHTLVPADTNCGGANTCNASGQCVGCGVASDCPGTDTPCRTRTCSATGVCGFALVAAGTKLADPTAGDCKGLQCDGNGNFQIVNDNTDVPTDSNACTTDSCSAGTPSHQPVASGTGCGGALVCDGAGSCVECVSASTCPGTDAECHTRTCISNHCGVRNTAAGTALAAQTAKDCKQSQCDGNGGTQTVPDDTDLPVDDNVCTHDVCTQGIPSNPFVTAGTTCAANQICDGNGACVGCVVASNCPGTDTECHTRTCVSHVCGVTNTAAGTAVLSQTPGDCKKNQCDGAGAVATVVDDTDKPVDGNACTQDLCANGAPSNPNVASGTSCGTSLVCNGTGACVGCVAASDCPGTDTPCQQRVCTNGQCGVSNAASGTDAGTQTAGDCHKNVCNGSGGVIAAIDNTDVPVDGNSCTSDVCLSGMASNPPVATGTACTQGGGSFCNVAGVCVQCLMAATCPGGPDTACHVRTCTNGTCGVANTSAGTLVTNTPVGNCHKDVCDGAGNVTTVVDNSDVPVDGNSCTSDVCSNGTPSNTPLVSGTSCGPSLICDGSGNCVGCVSAADCPGTDTTCSHRTCTNNQCGTTNAALGTLVTAAPAGDCQKTVCDGYGGTTTAPDDTDLPANSNPCLQSLCTSGVPSTPPKAQSTACSQGGGTECDGAGACVQCVTAADCPGGPDTECSYRTCTSGVCGVTTPAVNTPLAAQTPGDCQTAVCDGSGGTTTIADDTDVPTNTNQCTTVMCTGGAVQTTNSAHGTSCTQDSGRTCDGSGNCVFTFRVLRVGDGSTALANTATAVFIEERKLDGTSGGTTVSLPSTAASSGNAALTNSGSASSEGGLSLSADGRYLVLAGYNQTAGATGSVGGTASGTVNRVVGRVDAAGSVDTTTRISAAFSTNNVRGATSQDGTSFWVGGAGSGSGANAGGTWYITLGSTGAATQLVPTPALNNTRWPQIFGGQLYSSASTGSTFNNVLTVGTGLPTAGTPTMTAMTAVPGMPASGASPFGYLFLDTDSTAGYDTLYVADDTSSPAVNSIHDIQKWTLASGTWSKTTTFNLSTAVGFRGLTGFSTGSSVTLIATTDEALPRIIMFVDSGGTATSSTLATSGTNTAFRGVALSPHL